MLLEALLTNIQGTNLCYKFYTTLLLSLQFFCRCKSVHITAGSPPAFHSVYIGETAKETTAHHPKEMGEGVAVSEWGHKPSAHPVLAQTSPTAGASPRQCLLRLDQRQKAQSCSYIWKMLFH